MPLVFCTEEGIFGGGREGRLEVRMLFNALPKFEVLDLSGEEAKGLEIGVALGRLTTGSEDKAVSDDAS